MTEPAPEQIRDVVLGVPGIAALSAGPFSSVPVRPTTGIRIEEDTIKIDVVALYGTRLDDLGQQVASALGELTGGRTVELTVDDVVVPEQAELPAS